MIRATEAKQRALNAIEDQILFACRHGITGICIEYLREPEITELLKYGYNVVKYDGYNEELDCNGFYKITW